MEILIELSQALQNGDADLVAKRLKKLWNRN